MRLLCHIQCEINFAMQFFLEVGLGQLHYQGGRGVDMDHAVSPLVIFGMLDPWLFLLFDGNMV